MIQIHKPEISKGECIYSSNFFVHIITKKRFEIRTSNNFSETFRASYFTNEED